MDYIKYFRDWLNTSPWTNFVLLILTAIGVVITVLSLIKHKRGKKPYYSIGSIKAKCLTMDKKSKLSSQGIEFITRSTLVLWNRGKDVISREDVAPKDKLRLEMKPGCKFLDVQIPKEKDGTHNFSFKLNKDNNILYIHFDFLEFNDSMTLHIYHNAPQTYELELKGKIIGVRKIKRVRDPETWLFNNFVVYPISKLQKLTYSKLRIILIVLYVSIFSPFVLAALLFALLFEDNELDFMKK
jgi:hypothetical protein